MTAERWLCHQIGATTEAQCGSATGPVDGTQRAPDGVRRRLDSHCGCWQTGDFRDARPGSDVRECDDAEGLAEQHGDALVATDAPDRYGMELPSSGSTRRTRSAVVDESGVMPLCYQRCRPWTLGCS